MTSEATAAVEAILAMHPALEAADLAALADAFEDLGNDRMAELVRKGEISAENAYLYSPNPKVLERLI